MRRKLAALVMPTTTAGADPLARAKHDWLDAIIDSLNPLGSTFADLAKLLRKSDEWVRLKMLASHSSKLARVGKQYIIPRPVAEQFIRQHVN